MTAHEGPAVTDQIDETPAVAPDPAEGGAATRLASRVASRGIEPAPEDQGVPYAPLRLAALLGALAFVGYLNIWLLVVIAALVVMIFLHELGHYVMARRADIKVTEFFLFFGPRIWSFRRGETEYGIKCIPVGAYVKVIGMTNLDEVPPEDEPRTYRQKTFGQRVGVAVAGSTVHFLLAIGLIFVALALVGQPAGTFDPEAQAARWEIGEIVEGTGADASALQAGDRIVEIDGVEIDGPSAVRPTVEERAGRTVEVTYVRDGEVGTTEVEIREFTREGRTTPGLGIVLSGPPVERLNPLDAAVQAPVEFVRVAGLSMEAFGRFFSPTGISDFAGQVGSAREDRAAVIAEREGTAPPSSGTEQTGENRIMSIVGLVRLGADAGAVDPAGLVALFALVNIFIGIFNLVPLLPFDGGHVAIAVYEKVQELRLGRRRYFTDVTRLLPLTYAVFVALALLFASSLYLDLLNPLEIR